MRYRPFVVLVACVLSTGCPSPIGDPPWKRDAEEPEAAPSDEDSQPLEGEDAGASASEPHGNGPREVVSPVPSSGGAPSLHDGGSVSGKGEPPVEMTSPRANGDALPPSAPTPREDPPEVGPTPPATGFGGCSADVQCITANNRPRCVQGRCVECRDESDCNGLECTANTCMCRNGVPAVNGRCCGNRVLEPNEQCDVGAGDGFSSWVDVNCDKASCSLRFWQRCGAGSGTTCPEKSHCDGPTGTCAPTACVGTELGCIERITAGGTYVWPYSESGILIGFVGCPNGPYYPYDVYRTIPHCRLKCSTERRCPLSLTCGSKGFCIGPDATER